MGERLNGIQKVRGSNPLSSTILLFVYQGLTIFHTLKTRSPGIRGHGYEQILCFRSTVNTQNIEDSIKEVEKWDALVLHSIIRKLMWRH